MDHLGPEANIDREAQLVSRGVITAAERANRLLLRRIMQAGGLAAENGVVAFQPLHPRRGQAALPPAQLLAARPPTPETLRSM